MNEINTAGFYKLNEDGKWFLFAPNFVIAPNYSIQNKGQYKDGRHVTDNWYYFENEDNAVVYFELYEEINEKQEAVK